MNKLLLKTTGLSILAYLIAMFLWYALAVSFSVAVFYVHGRGGSMNDIILYLVGIVALVAVLVLLASNGRPAKFLRFVKTKAGKSIGSGWTSIIALSLIIALLSYCSKAFSGDFEYRVGFDESGRSSPYCTKEWNYSDSLSSNVAFIYWIAEYDHISFAVQQAHGSCVANQDENTYDATGAYAYAQVTKRFRLYAGMDYMYDLRGWVSVYGFQYEIYSSGTGDTGIGVGYTQRDIKAREFEAAHNFKGFGPYIRHRF